MKIKIFETTDQCLLNEQCWFQQCLHLAGQLKESQIDPMSAPAPVADTDEKTFMEKLTFVWSLFKGISILKRFWASRDCGGSTGAPKISVTNWRCIPISFAAHLHFWDMVKFKGFWLTISTQKTTATKKGFQKSSVKLIWRELWALLGIISLGLRPIEFLSARGDSKRWGKNHQCFTCFIVGNKNPHICNPGMYHMNHFHTIHYGNFLLENRLL